MPTITLRREKTAPLTHDEVDANFEALRDLTTGSVIEEQTIDATPALMESYEASNGYFYRMRLRFDAWQTGGSNWATWSFDLHVSCAGGTAVIEYGDDPVSAFKTNDAWDVTFDVSGRNVRTNLTGAAGATINWRRMIDSIDVIGP